MEPVADVIRVVLLAVAVTLMMLGVKFGYAGLRNGQCERSWAAATVVLLLGVTSYKVLGRFGEPLILASTAVYGLALVSGVETVRRLYTVHPNWTRVRLAAEREQRGIVRRETRSEEDALRAGDREAQVGERADSRAMFDAGHLDETTAAYDHRVEVREEQDENREHSHQLQDDERAAVRRDEDERD